MSKVVEYLFFCVWLIPLISSYSCLSTCQSFIPLMAEKYFSLCILHILFTQSLGRHSDCFQLLGIVNNVAMDIGIKLCVWQGACMSLT